MIDGKAYRDHWARAREGAAASAASRTRRRRATRCYVGLSEAVPSNAVRLRFSCHIEGVGVDPNNPPLVVGGVERRRLGAVRARLGRDRRPQPRRRRRRPRPEDARRVADREEAGRLDPRPGSRSRSRASRRTARRRRSRASPRSRSAGRSDGGERRARPGRGRRHLRRRARRAVHAQARPGRPRRRAGACSRSSGDEGWEEWTEVADFAGSTPADRHFVLDMSGGEIRLGPAVREADGTIRQYGAVPAKNARLRMRSYRTGGGRKGNLAARSLTVLKSSIPFVARVENRRAAQRRRRRRGHRERQGPRPDPAADARPGGHDRGLRAPRPRGGARGCPDPGGRGRRRRRRGLRAGARRAGGRTGRRRVPPLRPARPRRGDAPGDHRPPRGGAGHRDAGRSSSRRSTAA